MDDRREDWLVRCGWSTPPRFAAMVTLAATFAAAALAMVALVVTGTLPPVALAIVPADVLLAVAFAIPALPARTGSIPGGS